MRLQCPNCDAEYEVDTSAIPLDGRDVQCSNCGHGWFQNHPDFEPDYELEPVLFGPPPPFFQSNADTGMDLPRRELDPAALQILREEVALEEEKRAAEQMGVAIAGLPPAPKPLGDVERSLEEELDALFADQPALQAMPSVPNYAVAAQGALPSPEGFGDDDGQINAARLVSTANGAVLTERDIEFVTPLEDDQGVAAELSNGAQAQMVPFPPPANLAQPVASPPQDASQTNISARSDAQMHSDARAAKHPHGMGRRVGFYMVVLGAIVAVSGYIFGPDLAVALPQTAPYLAKYITFVNGLRDYAQTGVPQIGNMLVGAVQFLGDWVAARNWF